MRVICESVAPVPPGGWAILRVTSINDGSVAVAWPVRLHPDESTISFIVDGVRHRGAEQVDSIVATVTLEPGEAVSTGVAVSTGDRGVILPDAGRVEIQLAIRPPASNGEVLSNVCVVHVGSDVADAEGAGALPQLNEVAWSVRNGDLDDPSAVDAALASVPERDRPWVATALLPAAPLVDDVLLEAAQRLDTTAHTTADTASTAHAILHGLPYPADT